MATYPSRMTFPNILHPPFLISVEVLGDRGLRIVAEERAGRGPALEELPELGLTSREIIRHSSDATYEISWPVVVGFVTRGDPFPAGPSSTATIRDHGTQSAFLDWIKAESNADPNYVAITAGEDDSDSELRHWVISCNEARFDVAALDPPLVRHLD